MNDGGACRKAPATPGLLKRRSDLTLCTENVARLSNRYSDRSRIGFDKTLR